MNPLQSLLEEGVVDEVYQQLKTGKEAEVWLVSHRGVPVAAKIYKQREFRSFKNDAAYREGRQVRSSRTQRAMDKGSRFGRQASEEAWKSAEADALFALHGAGVRVPKPVLFYEGVLLMEAVADAEGRVAPRLVEAAIPREAAAGLYARVRAELVKMLMADLIHGDMSEFNVLLAADGPVLIDFPQVVTAAKNSRAEHFFKRDLGNIWRFFTSLDPALAKHEGDADEIWRAYVRRDLSEGFVPSGQPRPQRRGEPRGPGGPPQQRGQQPRGHGGPHPPGEGRPKRGGEGGAPRQNQQRSGPTVTFKGAPPGGGSGTSQQPGGGPRPGGGHRRRRRRHF